MLYYFSKFLATAYFALGLWLSFNHPLMPAVALVGFAILAVIGFASKTLWLAAIPSVLVLGSLYPWTGQLLFCEYDIGLCALLGGRLVGHSWLSESTNMLNLDSKSTRYSVVISLVVDSGRVCLVCQWDTRMELFAIGDIGRSTQRLYDQEQCVTAKQGVVLWSRIGSVNFIDF